MSVFSDLVLLFPLFSAPREEVKKMMFLFPWKFVVYLVLSLSCRGESKSKVAATERADEQKQEECSKLPELFGGLTIKFHIEFQGIIGRVVFSGLSQVVQLLLRNFPNLRERRMEMGKINRKR